MRRSPYKFVNICGKFLHTHTGTHTPLYLITCHALELVSAQPQPEVAAQRDTFCFCILQMRAQLATGGGRTVGEWQQGGSRLNLVLLAICRRQKQKAKAKAKGKENVLKGMQ